MAQPTEKKSEEDKNESGNPVEAGKKAIEVNKKIKEQDMPPQESDKEEKKDAEKWRNEG